jgi:hypothetical protein
MNANYYSVRNYIRVSCLLGLAVLVASCGGNSQVGRVLGFEKTTPDEFAVVKRAPLTLPPDYGLRPPKPGAPRPQAVSPRSDAKKSLLSASSKPPASASDTRSAARRAKRAQINAQAKGRSSSEVALLKRSGALGVDPKIRQTLNRESASASDVAEESLVDKLLFWQDDKQRVGSQDATVINAEAEARRMRENAALGKSTDAGRTPTIRRPTIRRKE